MHLVHRIVSCVVCLWLVVLGEGCAQRFPSDEIPPARFYIGDGRTLPSIRMSIDILDAIQAELFMTGVCKGGEAIEIGIARSKSEAHVLEVVYRVSESFQMFREAYIQEDGQVLLAEGIRGLDWRDRDTRSWVHAIDESDFQAAFRACSVQVHAVLDASITQGERQRQERRDAILYERLCGYPPSDSDDDDEATSAPAEDDDDLEDEDS